LFQLPLFLEGGELERTGVEDLVLDGRELLITGLLLLDGRELLLNVGRLFLTGGFSLIILGLVFVLLELFSGLW
jgi:hypothetical protein